MKLWRVFEHVNRGITHVVQMGAIARSRGTLFIYYSSDNYFRLTVYRHGERVEIFTYRFYSAMYLDIEKKYNSFLVITECRYTFTLYQNWQAIVNFLRGQQLQVAITLETGNIKYLFISSKLRVKKLKTRALPIFR